MTAGGQEMTRGYTPAEAGGALLVIREDGVPQGLILKPMRFIPQNMLAFNTRAFVLVRHKRCDSI